MMTLESTNKGGNYYTVGLISFSAVLSRPPAANIAFVCSTKVRFLEDSGEYSGRHAMSIYYCSTARESSHLLASIIVADKQRGETTTLNILVAASAKKKHSVEATVDQLLHTWSYIIIFSTVCMVKRTELLL